MDDGDDDTATRNILVLIKDDLALKCTPEYSTTEIDKPTVSQFELLLAHPNVDVNRPILSLRRRTLLHELTHLIFACGYKGASATTIDCLRLVLEAPSTNLDGVVVDLVSADDRFRGSLMEAIVIRREFDGLWATILQRQTLAVSRPITVYRAVLMNYVTFLQWSKSQSLLILEAITDGRAAVMDAICAHPNFEPNMPEDDPVLYGSINAPLENIGMVTRLIAHPKINMNLRRERNRDNHPMISLTPHPIVYCLDGIEVSDVPVRQRILKLLVGHRGSDVHLIRVDLMNSSEHMWEAHREILTCDRFDVHNVVPRKTVNNHAHHADH